MHIGLPEVSIFMARNTTLIGLGGGKIVLILNNLFHSQICNVEITFDTELVFP